MEGQINIEVVGLGPNGEEVIFSRQSACVDQEQQWTGTALILDDPNDPGGHFFILTGFRLTPIVERVLRERLFLAPRQATTGRSDD